MAGTTLRHIILDIQKILRQNIDDASITLSHILFHTITIADRLKSQHIEKRASGAFLHIYDAVPVMKAISSTNPDIIKGRHYFDLPSSIYDFNLDLGINYISYVTFDESCTPPFTYVTFSRTTPSESKILYMTDDEKPTPKNPYFYRVGRYVYLLGTECINLDKVEVGLYSSFDLSEYFKASCLLDEPFDFPPELISVLRREVLDLGRFLLLMPKDLLNDGSNELIDVPKTKIISVNDGAVSQQQYQQDQQQ
jgi:hypothetical protein